MSYITKNANMLLLFLIVLSATGLVAATVYFENNFERLNKDYEGKVAELIRISSELQQKRDALEKASRELVVKGTREEEIAEQFTEVRTEKEELATKKAELEKSKAQLEAEVSELNLDLQKLERERLDLQNEVNILESDLRTTRASLAKASADLSNERSAHSACNTALATCQAGS